MSVRFRIRTSQGQEVSFASREMFAEFVRSGDLSPEDVVYDAETKEWSSALTHPVVLQIELDSADEAAEGSEASDIDGTGTAADTGPSAERPQDDQTSGIGLELAPAAEPLTPEQAGAAFVKKMEAERASELKFDEEPGIQGFKMEQGSSGFSADLVHVPEPPPPPPPPPPAPERAQKRAKPDRVSQPRKQVKAGTEVTRNRHSGAGRRYAPPLIVAVLLVAGGVYFGPQLLAPETAEAPDLGGESVPPPPPPAPLIPDTEEALRERAHERFLTTTRALVRDLPPIPDIWLGGAYLAAPSDYPQVRQVWSLYLTTVQQTRAGDDERYRAGYVRALDDARVEGSARTLRLASAVSAFQGEGGARAAHYDRVEALATAALRGHDALVEVEGTIAYEPAAGSPVSGDPVIEAVGRNPEAQDLLNQVLDMILAELEGPDGPGQAANVAEWLWDGLLDAVAN